MRMNRLALAFAAAALLTTPAAAADAGYVDGVFEGGYTCAQGVTFLRLTLDGQYDGTVRGRFFFSSASWQGGSNRTVPDGEFTVVGRLSGDGRIVLQGDSWVLRPADYEMVDLAGNVFWRGGKLVIEGNVTGAPSCQSFSVDRD